MKNLYSKLVILAFVWTALFSFSGSALASEDEIILIVNDELCEFTADQAKPQLVDDRVYVPLRVISQKLGHSVEWFSANNQIFIATKSWKGTPVASVNTMGRLEVIIDGQLMDSDEQLGQPFVLEGGYTMLPLRAVGNALDCEIEWSSGVAIVKERPQKAEEPVIAAKPVDNQSDAQMALANPNHALTIIGENIATEAQINKFLADKAVAVKAKIENNYTDREFIPFPPDIAKLYLEIGQKYHIRGDIALAQALKETGYFQFEGSVQSFQNNYCGLGATGLVLIGDEIKAGVDPQKVFYVPGMHGISFTTPAYGVEAHLQHLYAYGSRDNLPIGRELLDPRFSLVTRGIATRWIDLDGRWAVPGDGYGESILDDYWAPMLEY